MDEVISDYVRVIPRDFYNESKLLKCYGRLALLALDGFVPKGFEVRCSGSSFAVRQRQSDGGLVIPNVRVEMHGRKLDLYHPYNSRKSWPLQCELDLAIDDIPAGDSIDVFENSETEDLSEDFLAYLQVIDDSFMRRLEVDR